MSNIEIVFKFKEKETKIKCNDNYNLYEIFKKNILYNDNNKYHLYFEGKIINKEIIINKGKQKIIDNSKTN